MSRSPARILLGQTVFRSFRIVMTMLAFDVYPLNGRRIATETEIRQLIVAADVARDTSPPPHCFYRLAPALLTQASRIDVLGLASTGAVNAVLVDSPLGTLVGIGSDHTDSALAMGGVYGRNSASAAYGTALAKQVCAKPLSRDAWFYEDVAPHWDRLIMRSWLVSTDASDAGHAPPEVYQAGPLSELLPPEMLWEHCRRADAASRTSTSAFSSSAAASRAASPSLAAPLPWPSPSTSPAPPSSTFSPTATPTSFLTAFPTLTSTLSSPLPAPPSTFGTTLFGGTLAVNGELATMRSGETFEIELHDPVLDRRLRHRYALNALPVNA